MIFNILVYLTLSFRKLNKSNLIKKVIKNLKSMFTVHQNYKFKAHKIFNQVIQNMIKTEMHSNNQKK